MGRFLSSLLKLIFILPIALFVIILALANRTPVLVSLDPFSKDIPAYSFAAPLYMLLLGAIMLGILIGGIASWLKQGKNRRLARTLGKEAERQRNEVERLKAVLPATLLTMPAKR